MSTHRPTSLVKRSGSDSRQSQLLVEKPSEAAARELEVQYFRVNNAIAAQRAWERLFSVEDRSVLNQDLRAAYQECHGLVGIWMKLRGVSQPRAVIDLAHALGFSAPNTRDWLLGEFDESPALGAAAIDVPHWDPDRRELRFRNKIARTVLRPKQAKDIVTILMAFQALNWRPQIDDPLGERDTQRLHKAIYSLNRGLKFIRFHGDGTGAGITWKQVASRGMRAG